MSVFTLDWVPDTVREWQPGDFGEVFYETTLRYETLSIPELSNGFVYQTGAGKPVSIRHFRIDVPRSGNYIVNIRFAASIPGLSVCTGRRRFALLRAASGQMPRDLELCVNVRDIVPRGKTEPMRGDSVDITLTLIGGALPEESIRIDSIRVREVPGTPTLYIAGDSTVTDQAADLPWSPGECYCGWGQMLSLFLKTGIALSNHAHSGLTTQSFREGGHWRIVRDALAPGDFVMFQFGHNDQKIPSLDAFGGYAENLARFTTETQERGAIPIIVSPVSRNLWNGPGGSFNDLLSDWAAACSEVSKRHGAYFVDLHNLSAAFVRRLGERAASAYFHPSDYTHHNDFGGAEMAGFVADELRTSGPPALAAMIRRTSVGRFEKPAIRAAERNVGNHSGQTAARPDVPAGDTHRFPARPAGSIGRAEFTAAMMSALRILPAQVYSDAFADVSGDEWFAGSMQAAKDHGFFPSDMIRDNCIGPDAAISRTDAAVMLERAIIYKRGLDPHSGKQDHDSETVRTMIEAASRLLPVN